MDVQMRQVLLSYFFFKSFYCSPFTFYAGTEINLSTESRTTETSSMFYLGLYSLYILGTYIII